MNKLKLKSIMTFCLISLVAIIFSSLFYFEVSGRSDIAKPESQIESSLNVKNLNQDEMVSEGEEDTAQVVISNDLRGQVEGGGRFAVGSTVTIKATANEGLEFINWQIWDGQTSSYIDWTDENGQTIVDPEYTFTLQGDITSRAYFDYKKYTITNNFDSFDLTELSYEFDNERFSLDETAEYPKAIITEYNYNRPSVGSYSNGNFYYNDIVKLGYTIKTGINVKQLSYDDFDVKVGSTANIDNSNLVIIHIDKNGNFLAEERGGEFVLQTGTFDIDSYLFDYSNERYIILTQDYVGTEAEEEYTITAGAKYITTNMIVLTKVTDNLDFVVEDSQLKTLYVVAYEWFSNISEVAIDVEDVENLINFEYGYFGQLENAKLTKASLTNESQEISCLQFIVEENANFKFSFLSNNKFNFIRALGSSTDSSYIGYFDSDLFLSGSYEFSVSFERIKYNLTFSEYFIDGTSYTKLPTADKMYNISVSTTASTFVTNSFKLYPTESFTLDLDTSDTDGISLILPERLGSVSLTANDNLYGYILKEIVLDFSQANTNVETLTGAIDGDSPADLEVKIILEKVAYNLKVEVLNNTILENNKLLQEEDANAELADPIDEYFASKISLGGSFVGGGLITDVLRNQLISLTADSVSGYKIIGWKIFNGDYLTTSENPSSTSFNFTPTTNDNTSEIVYQLVVDYDYLSPTYLLDGIEKTTAETITTYTYKADLDILHVTSVKYDNTTSNPTLTLIAKQYRSTETSEETALTATEEIQLSLELISTNSVIVSANGNISVIRYATSVGNVLIEKEEVTTDDTTSVNILSVSINNVKFKNVSVTNGTTTLIPTKTTSKAITINAFKGEKVVEGEDETSAEFRYTISNATSDDLLLFRSKATDDTSYKLRYYLYGKDTKTATQSFNAEFKKAETDDLDGQFYFYIYQKNHGENITAVYINKAQEVEIKANNPLAYDVNNLDVSLSNGSFQLLEEVVVISVEQGQTVALTLDTQHITKGYKFDKMIIDNNGSSSNLAFTSESGQIKFSFTMGSSYAGANIILSFSPIDYKLNIEYETQIENTGNVDFTINGNGSTSSLTATDGKISGYFNINIEQTYDTNLNAELENDCPKLTLNSAQGYYIANAYIGSDETLNIIDSLVGSAYSQTSSSWIISREVFLSFIVNLSSDTYDVTLHIKESERLYSLNVIYVLGNSDKSAELVKNAVTIIKDYNNLDEETNVIASAQANYSLDSRNYELTFADISYGQILNLTMEDAEVAGAYFDNWLNSDKQLLDLTNGFEIKDNATIYASFNLIDYKLEFKLVRAEDVANLDNIYSIINLEEDRTRGKVAYDVDGVITTSMNIADSINFNVSVSTGYAFKETGGCYYLASGVKTFNNIVNNGNKSYSILSFDPSTMPGYSKENQIKDEKYRTFTIYLEFSVKVYTVNCETSSYGINTTSVNVEDWVNYEVTGDSYSEAGETKYYATNSQITVNFETTFNAINLHHINFHSNTYKINNISLTETNYYLAGQYVSLDYSYNSAKGYYTGTLIFNLNTELLSALDEDGENFTIKFSFQAKKYSFKVMGDGYSKEAKGINFSWQDSMGNGVSKDDLAVSLKTGAYGQVLNFASNSSSAKIALISGQELNFNDVYKISAITLSYDGIVSPVTLKSYGTQEFINIAEYKIPADIIFENEDGEYSVAFWDYIANVDKEIIITFVYVPKISLDNFTFDQATNTWRKTSQYNAKAQSILDDIIYDKTYFTSAPEITYNGRYSDSSYPKNAGVYSIVITIGGVSFYDNVELEITKAQLTLAYTGGVVSKVYDGTNQVTDAGKTNVIIPGLKLVGLQGSDSATFITKGIYAVYSSKAVGEGYDVEVFNINVSDSLKTNYIFEVQNSSLVLQGKGKISKLSVSIDERIYFDFNDIVYKKDIEPLLVNINADANINVSTPEEDYNKIFIKNTIEGDSVYIDKNVLKFVLEDYSIGYNKPIKINLAEALSGADKDNYSISDKYVYIDIYPYELVCEVENKGIFKIIDLDEKLIIPIEISPEDGLKVNITETTAPNYKDLFSLIEDVVRRDEKVYGFIEFVVTTKSGNSVNTDSFAGAYMTFEPFSDVATIYTINGQELKEVDYQITNKVINLKIEKGQHDMFALLLSRTYFPIWAIILIIIFFLLLLLLLIILLLILRRKRKEKYAEHDKIK